MASNPFPDISDQLAPNSPAPQPQPEAGGRLRGLLSNFFQGAGSAMMKQVGLPTPEEQAQKQFQNQMAVRQFQSNEELKQAQIQSYQAEQQPVPFQLPNGASVILPAKHAATLAASLARGQYGVQTNTATNQKDVTVAGINATSRENVADTNAQNKPPNEIALIQRMLAGDKGAAATLDQLQKNRVALASAKGQAFGSFRPGAYIDNEGNVIADYAGSAIAKGYTPAVQGASAMSKQAQFGEVKSGSVQLRNSIIGLDKDFTPDQRVKLSLAMRAPDESALYTVVNSMLGTEQLTKAQQDFVIAATQMHERVLSLRNIAGIGQGSDSTRAALQATIPNVNMADKAYGLKQLDAVDNQIDQLYRGVPKVKSFKSDSGIPEVQPPRPSNVPAGYTFKANGPKGRGWYKR